MIPAIPACYPLEYFVFLALGFFVLEVLNVYEVSNIELALRTLLTVVAIGGAVTAVTAAHFGRTATSWSCLGNFAEGTTDL
ncbi:hypothetical protein Aduo_013242 [Ancylostoma duodenale]